MDEDVIIPGVGLRGYRSFGGRIQYFAPLKKINILIGTNNSGKSNVLRFINGLLPNAIEKGGNRPGELDIDKLDRPRQSQQEGIVVSFGWPTEDFLENRLSSDLNPRQHKLAKTLLTSDIFGPQDNYHWLSYECKTHGGSLELSKAIQKAAKSDENLSATEWSDIWTALTGRRKGDLEQHWIPQTLEELSPINTISNLDPVFIPAIREIEYRGGGANPGRQEAGSKIRDRLAQLERPEIGSRANRKKFDRIQEFLRNVTGEPEAELEIPYGEESILVKMQGRELPLTSLGTGIHEVVILAATATTVESSIVCIEEPEVHLHPTLQRKLLRYLRHHTDNQYFIATHSAHILNVDDSAIFHLRLEDGWSTVDAAVTDRRKFTALQDLGYQASDLLQTNCVIWVEGPSDRVYINHWIDSVDNDLVEGLHYSIMFYGGGLLSHLSAEDDQVEDFIELQRLNRNVALVMDSDRENKKDRRNKTKVRVENEIEEANGFVWSTKGREIENYVPPELMLRAIQSVDESARELMSEDRFAKAYKYTRGAEKTHSPRSKVKLARAVADRPADLSRLDLEEKIVSLVSFIREANDDL